MTLNEAENSLKSLKSELNYWLIEKEKAKSLIIPKAVDIRAEKVVGGEKKDNMLEYCIILDEKKINETIDYIKGRIERLNNYIEESKKILLECVNDRTKRIITKRESGWRWEAIANSESYSEKQCRRLYNKYYKNKLSRINKDVRKMSDII